MNKMGKWLGLGVLTFMPLWVMAEDEHLLR